MFKFLYELLSREFRCLSIRKSKPEKNGGQNALGVVTMQTQKLHVIWMEKK